MCTSNDSWQGPADSAPSTRVELCFARKRLARPVLLRPMLLPFRRFGANGCLCRSAAAPSLGVLPPAAPASRRARARVPVLTPMGQRRVQLLPGAGVALVGTPKTKTALHSQARGAGGRHLARPTKLQRTLLRKVAPMHLAIHNQCICWPTIVPGGWHMAAAPNSTATPNTKGLSPGACPGPCPANHSRCAHVPTEGASRLRQRGQSGKSTHHAAWDGFQTVLCPDPTGHICMRIYYHKLTH